MRIDPVSLF